MAKRQARVSRAVGARKPSAQDAPVQSKIGDFAEDLGRLLGSAERKATEWLDQRQTVATQLTAIRDKATALLTQLGRGSSDAPQRRKRGSSAKRTSGSKKRVVSAETRAKMAAAQQKRWAAKRGKS